AKLLRHTALLQFPRRSIDYSPCFCYNYPMENYSLNLRAEVNSEAQLIQALEREELRFVYAPARLLNAGTPRKNKIIASPPVFLADCEKETLKKLCELKASGFDHALAHTVGHIPLIKKAGMIPHGGLRLNITNSRSAEFFAEDRFADIVLSCELTAKRINRISCRIPFGIIAYGRLPLMITRRCPINDGKPCGGKKSCGGFLEDRRGEKIRLICSNTVELLNPNVLSIANRLSDFPAVNFFIMRFTDEKNIADAVNSFIKGEKPSGSVTAGLYYRGVE
ncbi:MAG: U32 family peptidase, partial [Bacteroides sp.]|nr:U32 family peptidase [Bacteroides sp.]